MKANIHPTYFPDAQVVCACGNTFTTGSTKQQIRVEICSNCHPFYTGQQKFADIKGNIDKFQARVQAATTKKATIAAKKSKEEAKEEVRPRTLREMLMSQK